MVGALPPTPAVGDAGVLRRLPPLRATGDGAGVGRLPTKSASANTLIHAFTASFSASLGLLYRVQERGLSFESG
uniref:Uncharacterized protein n=1 Tax=Roseihalotalea indica TaxID=2867963 RepID=A0AA49GL04_9BACT|nr:hypothetical protein K4G66_31100 [Tunicatimonas sp. TK19036]